MLPPETFFAPSFDRRSALALPAILLLTACGGASTKTTMTGQFRSTGPARTIPMTTIVRGSTTSYQTSAGAVESRVFGDAGAWRRFWIEHAGPTATPPVMDFSKDQVLAVFAGDCPSEGFGLRITAVIAHADGRREARYERSRPATGESPPAIPTRPYHLVRTPRTSRPVLFLPVAEVETVCGHGELIAGAAGPQLLAPDGRLLPVRSEAPLIDAGGAPGQTFRYVAIRRGPELELESVQLDDFDHRARVTAAGTLVDREGRPITIQGSLPGTIQGLRADAPVRVCGRRQGTAMTITAAWPVRVFELRRAGGLLGLNERLELELESGRVWFHRSLRAGSPLEFQARIDLAELGFLTGLLESANLPAAPASFPALLHIADAPKVTLALRDGARDVSVRVEPGSQPPAEVTALLTEARRLMDDLRQNHSP